MIEKELNVHSHSYGNELKWRFHFYCNGHSTHHNFDVIVGSKWEHKQDSLIPIFYLHRKFLIPQKLYIIKKHSPRCDTTVLWSTWREGSTQDWLTRYYLGLTNISLWKLFKIFLPKKHFNYVLIAVWPMYAQVIYLYVRYSL